MMQRWSGKETRALREAKRMSIRAFADHIGVSHRMISKWEAGGAAVHPRPANQAALDTAFATAAPDVKERFLASLRTPSVHTRATDMVLPAAIASKATAHPVDGKLMVRVDEGLYLSGPEDKPVWLAAFTIDIFPTTNAEYAQFIAATGHPAPKHWEDGRFPDALADHPVVFVSWRDAQEYASWAGKRLPSNKQWERAARGNAGNIYPWGCQETFAKANVRESGNGGTTPVSCYQSGVSPYGVYDLCGNTWEWCSTESTNGRYELKGSAFTSPFDRATPSRFNDAAADMLDDDTGFRCVST